MEEQVEQTASEAPVEAPVEQTAQERPEWLPEKFQTPEDLRKSYDELSSKLGKGEEELRKSIMEEIETDAFSQRPASVGEYVLPEILDEEAAVDNELLDWWSNYSWENGLSQEEFAEGIEKYANAIMETQPDLDAVAKELGDNANERVEAVQLWMNKFFPDAEMQEAIATLGSSAAGIKALEHIIEQTKSGNISPQGNVAGQITQADVEAKMKDPRYWQQGKRDPAFVAEVNNEWKRLYG